MNMQNLTKKLTDWKNEPTVAALKNDLLAATSYHDTQMAKINRWNALMSQGVSGNKKNAPMKGRSTIQPKLIRRQAEWRYSALTEPFLGSNKLFKVSPVTFEDAKAAKQNELVLNWQFNSKINKVKFIDDFVRSTVDEGTSIVRVGWKRAVTKVIEEVPEYSYFAIQSEEELQLLQQALDLEAADPRTYLESPPELMAAVEYYKETGTPVMAQQTAVVPMEVEKILENRPTLEVLNPANVYVDPSCNGDFDKALFVIVGYETNKAEIKRESGKYINLDAVDWDNNSAQAVANFDSTTDTSFKFEDKTRKKVVVYEYWGFYDINDTGEVEPIVAAWIGDTLIRLEANPFPDKKLPFTLTTYLPVKRDLFGEPDAELLEDNQKIIGAVSRGMIDLLGRSANAQQGIAKGMLDPLNRKRYEEGRDYEFNPSVHPTNGIIEHKYPDIPNSAMLMLNLQNQEAEALTGVKSFSGGIGGNTYGDVAAGIKGTLDAASKREMAILRRLAKGMSIIGSKIISMNGDFLSDTEVVRVTNSEFVQISREDLAGQFDLETDISTAEIDNQKAADMAFMLQTIGNTVSQDILMLLLSQIAALKKMPDLAEKLANYKPEPDPMQQQLQEIELEKAKAELLVLQTEAALNQAKTAQVAGEAQQKQLDHDEQAYGVKHGREMEKQQAQARGNQALQVTKALTSGEAPDIEAAIGYNTISEQLTP